MKANRSRARASARLEKGAGGGRWNRTTCSAAQPCAWHHPLTHPRQDPCSAERVSASSGHPQRTGGSYGREANDQAWRRASQELTIRRKTYAAVMARRPAVVTLKSVPSDAGAGSPFLTKPT